MDDNDGIKRVWVVTDRNGVPHVIRCQRDLDELIAQMTPAEYKTWQDNYRFAPIRNKTGNQDYTGTLRDRN